MPPFESLPYRPCAGMMVLNRAGLVFIGRRASGPEHIDETHVWQMPQGGIDENEDPYKAALRELYEETNIRTVEKLGEIPNGSPTISRATSSARHGAANIAGRSRNGLPCASPATTAKSTSSIPAADTSRNSSTGAGWRWPNCPTWWCRSNGRLTSGWSRNSRNSRGEFSSRYIGRSSGAMTALS